MTELSDLYFRTNVGHYDERPVGIETFIHSPEYMGHLFGITRENMDKFNYVKFGCYPYWLRILKIIHPNPFTNPFIEVICLLPIGSGKTFSYMLSAAYDLHKLLCLTNPQQFYNVKQRIALAIFSASKTLAEDDNWQMLHSMFDKSPWFRARGFVPKMRQLEKRPTIEMRKGLSIAVGSQAQNVLGKAIFGGVLDEANFQRKKSQQAEKSYAAITRRRESRFMWGGEIPGTFWLLSSPKNETAFLLQSIKNAENRDDVLIIKDKPIYEIDAHRKNYSKKRFVVFEGDERVDPCFVEPDRIAFYSYAHVPWTSRGQRLFDEQDLPSAEEKMQLYILGKTLFTEQGYTDIGMDHFSLPEDDLYKVWKEGKLHRNFMGYTTQRTAMMIGLGVSSISDAGVAFAQNHKTVHEYYQSIEGEELPITKGFFLNDEDVSFRKYILDISCKFFWFSEVIISVNISYCRN